MDMKFKLAILALGVLTIICAGSLAAIFTLRAGNATELAQNDLIFIHHSVGKNWLDNSLQQALIQKPYIDHVNDTFYGTYVPHTAGRPDSLGPRAGNLTDSNHWLFWFNDYLDGLKRRDNPAGFIETTAEKITARLPAAGPFLNRVTGQSETEHNKIIMFKSCFLDNNIEESTGKGDPFSEKRTLANMQAIFRHPDGPGHTYTVNGYQYKPLEDIFADNPDTLFIFVTNPPSHYGPEDAITDEKARLNRALYDWLKDEWLGGYNQAHPGLNNVAIFDLHDVWAYPDDHPEHPNRLKAEFGGNSGDSHPNGAANAYATELFASNPENFIDPAWNRFQAGN
jgi:hypothetical protein